MNNKVKIHSYICPEIEVIEVESENIIASSPGEPGIDNNDSASITRGRKRFWNNEED